MAPWDPLATARFTSQRATTPATDALAGAGTVVSLSQPANFGYSQLMQTGTQYSVSFGTTKSTTNSGFATLNPALSSSISINFTQPLIKNRGVYVNRLSLMTARSRYRKSEYDLRTALIQMVVAAENAYWDVIQARENLRVQESARQLAEESLKLSQKELELGAISPLDIYNPQQQLAGAELAVTDARFSLLQSENALRRQMGADLDSQVRVLPVVLTETLDVPVDSISIDGEEEIRRAMANRPELKSAAQSLDVDDLTIQQARNGLLPDLSLIGAYTSQGIGGVLYHRTNIFAADGTASSILTTVPGGFGDALTQMFGLGYPVYLFGLNLRLPIRSRSASADMADALVAKKRDALAVRTTEQQVRLDVGNAVVSLEGSREAAKLAITARDFAQKYLDAENQKFQLGVDTMFFVLQAQKALAQAESAVVQNQVSLRRNMLNLLARTGMLLDERGIMVQ
jgi:outer membrane protein TolC